MRSIQQGLGWNATAIEANAAQALVALNENHFLAQVGGVKGRGVTAGAGANYDEIGGDGWHNQICLCLYLFLCLLLFFAFSVFGVSIRYTTASSWNLPASWSNRSTSPLIMHTICNSTAFPLTPLSGASMPLATSTSRHPAHSVAAPRASSKNFARIWRWRFPLPSAVFNTAEILARSSWSQTSRGLPVEHLIASSIKGVTHFMK